MCGYRCRCLFLSLLSRRVAVCGTRRSSFVSLGFDIYHTREKGEGALLYPAAGLCCVVSLYTGRSQELLSCSAESQRGATGRSRLVGVVSP